LVLLPQTTEETNATNTEHTSQTMPTAFLGNWSALDNKTHVNVSADAVRWDRGANDGPEIVPTSKCNVLPKKNAILFPVRSSAGAMVGGKPVRGIVIVEMTVAGDMLTIIEGASETIKDPASGFAFQQDPSKYIFKKEPKQ